MITKLTVIKTTLISGIDKCFNSFCSFVINLVILGGGGGAVWYGDFTLVNTHFECFTSGHLWKVKRVTNCH